MGLRNFAVDVKVTQGVIFLEGFASKFKPKRGACDAVRSFAVDQVPTGHLFERSITVFNYSRDVAIPLRLRERDERRFALNRNALLLQGIAHDLPCSVVACDTSNS